MYKIIGSLLLVSLLSRPAVLRIDFLAYEVYKSQNHIIAIVKRINYENEKKSDTEAISEVDTMMADIDSNIHSINSLLKEKNNLLGKIQTNMSLKAYSKTAMTEEQITSFQSFYSDYVAKSDKVNSVLSEIEQQLSVKNAIDLFNTGEGNENNYDEIISRLKEISDRQYEAMFTLSSIIEQGENTLAII